MKRQHLFKSNINIYFICIFPFQTNLYKKFFISTSSYIWGIERSGFFNGREKWAKGFENQRV